MGRDLECDHDWGESIACVKCAAWRGALGLESRPAEYVAHIVEVFRAVRRVLRPDGTLWLNLGDSYAAKRGYQVADNKHRDVGNSLPSHVPAGLKPKDLVGMPWRVAFALQEDGWWLRSEIIWHKTNPMPESVGDRPTRAHETVFLMTKQDRYYYDAEAIRQPSSEGSAERQKHSKKGIPRRDDRANDSGIIAHAKRTYGSGVVSGANARSVWGIPVLGYFGCTLRHFPHRHSQARHSRRHIGGRHLLRVRRSVAAPDTHKPRSNWPDCARQGSHQPPARRQHMERKQRARFLPTNDHNHGLAPHLRA